jgi:hypothetical protein
MAGGGLRGPGVFVDGRATGEASAIRPAHEHDTHHSWARRTTRETRRCGPGARRRTPGRGPPRAARARGRQRRPQLRRRPPRQQGPPPTRRHGTGGYTGPPWSQTVHVTQRWPSRSTGPSHRASLAGRLCGSGLLLRTSSGSERVRRMPPAHKAQPTETMRYEWRLSRGGSVGAVGAGKRRGAPREAARARGGGPFTKKKNTMGLPQSTIPFRCCPPPPPRLVGPLLTAHSVAACVRRWPCARRRRSPP